MSSAAADTSEDKDDEEIVALLPTSSADDRKGDGLVADNIRRTPGPNAMRRPNQNVSILHFMVLSFHINSQKRIDIKYIIINLGGRTS